jgi:hypothetical protein
LECWMMHLFSCESPSLELNFCYPSLNLSCGYFLGKAQPPNSWICLIHFHTAQYFLPPCSLNLRDTVSPQTVVTSDLWEVINLPFCLLRQAWMWTRVLASLKSGASLPSLVPETHWVPLCIWGLHLDLPGGWVPLWIKLSVGAWWDLFLVVQGMHLGDKRGDKSLSPQSLQWAPKKCCGNLKLRYGTLRQFSRKQCFIVPAQTQQTHVHRLSPENKGVSPYVPLQADYRSKKQSSNHIWLHVTSLAISFPQCYVTFMFQFLKFYLSALPSLSPTPSSEHSLSLSL